MGKLEELLAATKLNDLLNRRQEEEKKKNALLWVLAIIGAVAAVAAIAYAVYRYLAPDYLEELEDEYDDEFDDEFFLDGEEDIPEAGSEAL